MVVCHACSTTTREHQRHELTCNQQSVCLNQNCLTFLKLSAGYQCHLPSPAESLWAARLELCCLAFRRPCRSVWRLPAKWLHRICNILPSMWIYNTVGKALTRTNYKTAVCLENECFLFWKSSLIQSYLSQCKGSGIYLPSQMLPTWEKRWRAKNIPSFIDSSVEESALGIKSDV